MPPLTRWYIKLALVNLVLGLLTGALIAAQPQLRLPAALSAAGPVYVHLLVVGWITQMIFGVAYWMFPKDSAERPRGSDHLAVATFVLLNVGLAVRVVIEPWHLVAPGVARGWLLAGAAACQWLAGVGFVLGMWPRVKGR
jgi:hypothetical protein